MSLFISFEGIEGTGKTTQIRLLDDFLKLRNYETVLTREPGGTTISDKIRTLLLDSQNNKMSPLTELFLYAASRVQHLEELIKPSLETKKIVLCDRFSDATTAYQGYGRGFSQDLIKAIHQLTIGKLRPHLTFLFDCDPQIGLKRAWERIQNLDKNKQAPEDRFEKEEISFHQKVRDGYLKIARDNPERFVVLDASQTIEETHEQITQEVLKHL